jgi:hypothetical protein
MKVNLYPPPIYRLDKINSYIKAKLDDYLRESKEQSKEAFDKVIFMRMFFENELTEAKSLLIEVGKKNRADSLNPYSMSLARSGYGYAKDHESIQKEKEFFKFYIITIEKILINLDKSPAVLPIDNFEIQKNQNPTIFKNDLGQTIFNDLHNLYKNEDKILANYSFVFYALQKKYLVCSNANFINYLSTLDIQIDKIDSRQSGNTNKTSLFNAVESKYLRT